MEKTIEQIEQTIENVYDGRRDEHLMQKTRPSELATVIVEMVNAVRTDTVLDTRLALAELGFISSTPRELMALWAEKDELASKQPQVKEMA